MSTYGAASSLTSSRRARSFGHALHFGLVQSIFIKAVRLDLASQSIRILIGYVTLVAIHAYFFRRTHLRRPSCLLAERRMYSSLCCRM